MKFGVFLPNGSNGCIPSRAAPAGKQRSASGTF